MQGNSIPWGREKGPMDGTAEKKQILKPGQKMVNMKYYLFPNIEMRSKVEENLWIKESNNATEERNEGIFRCFKICAG